MEDQLIEGERLVCSKHNKIAMKDGNGYMTNARGVNFQAVRTLPKGRPFASNMARPYIAVTGKNAQHMDVALILCWMAMARPMVTSAFA